MGQGGGVWRGAAWGETYTAYDYQQVDRHMQLALERCSSSQAQHYAKITKYDKSIGTE